jgi:hypothetical protein
VRDSRLRDAELGLDDPDNGARGVLAGGEQLQDAAAHGVAEDIEGVHRF